MAEAKKKPEDGPPLKQGITMKKLGELTASERAKVTLEDLWVMEPEARKAAARARYCGCRSVCKV